MLDMFRVNCSYFIDGDIETCLIIFFYIETLNHILI